MHQRPKRVPTAVYEPNEPQSSASFAMRCIARNEFFALIAGDDFRRVSLVTEADPFLADHA
jgi:hypothetical protein